MTFKKIQSIVNYLFMLRYSCEEYARKIGVKVGNGCYISTRSFSSEPYLIEIGDNVRIAKNVKFLTHGGIWTLRKKYPDLDYFGKISIGNNTFIGEGSYILPGVIIGSNCIIGAASVVTKSIPDGFMAAGNPVKLVGRTIDFEEKILLKNLKTKSLNSTEKRNYLQSLSSDMFIQKPYL